MAPEPSTPTEAKNLASKAGTRRMRSSPRVVATNYQPPETRTEKIKRLEEECKIRALELKKLEDEDKIAALLKKRAMKAAESQRQEAAEDSSAPGETSSMQKNIVVLVSSKTESDKGISPVLTSQQKLETPAVATQASNFKESPSSSKSPFVNIASPVADSHMRHEKSNVDSSNAQKKRQAPPMNPEDSRHPTKKSAKVTSDGKPSSTTADHHGDQSRHLGLVDNSQPKNAAEHAVSSTKVTRSASSASNMRRAPIATVPSSAPRVNMNDYKDAGRNPEVSNLIRRSAKNRRLPNDAVQSSEDADSNRPQQSPTSKTNTNNVPIGIQRHFEIAKTNPPSTVGEPYRPKAICQCVHHAELRQLREDVEPIKIIMKTLVTQLDTLDAKLQVAL